MIEIGFVNLLDQFSISALKPNKWWQDLLLAYKILNSITKQVHFV